jgi:hypothetical protein
MTGSSFDVLGQGVVARRRWRGRWLADAVSGTLLVAVCVTLWIGLLASVARPDLTDRPTASGSLRH